MQYVPLGFCLIVSAATGIVVTEAIHHRIPERPVSPNQFRFHRNNEIAFDAIENHELALEIRNLQGVPCAMLLACSRNL